MTRRFEAHDFADLPLVLLRAIQTWPDDLEREWMLSTPPTESAVTAHREPLGFVSFRFCAHGRELVIFREHDSYFLRGATLEALN